MNQHVLLFSFLELSNTIINKIIENFVFALIYTCRLIVFMNTAQSSGSQPLFLSWPMFLLQKAMWPNRVLFRKKQIKIDLEKGWKKSQVKRKNFFFSVWNYKINWRRFWSRNLSFNNKLCFSVSIRFSFLKYLDTLL